MTLLDTALTAAAGATAGMSTAFSGGQFALSLLSAAVGAGIAYGILKKATETQERELHELKAWLGGVEHKLDDVRERVARIEGVCVLQHPTAIYRREHP